MKKTLTLLLSLGLCTQVASALSFNETITAIFGAGNPDTGWTVEQNPDGITLAMRGKHRVTADTSNIEGTYSFPTGLQAPNNNRALWNWEFSINSGAVSLDTYDYYIGVDNDTSQEIFHQVIDAFSFTDNSYGNDSTLNGQGVEGLAALLAPLNNIAQQSQNLVFYGLDPNLNATYDYELYAVAKGAGSAGTKLVSVGITVVVGAGGPAFLDADSDGVSDRNDQCPDSLPGDTVTASGCTIQELVNICAAGAVTHGDYVSCIADLANQLSADGIITNKQRQQMITTAAKSDIGN